MPVWNCALKCDSLSGSRDNFVRCLVQCLISFNTAAPFCRVYDVRVFLFPSLSSISSLLQFLLPRFLSYSFPSFFSPSSLSSFSISSSSFIFFVEMHVPAPIFLLTLLLFSHPSLSLFSFVFVQILPLHLLHNFCLILLLQPSSLSFLHFIHLSRVIIFFPCSFSSYLLPFIFICASSTFFYSLHLLQISKLLPLSYIITNPLSLFQLSCRTLNVFLTLHPLHSSSFRDSTLCACLVLYYGI